jgi:hypothetical protein
MSVASPSKSILVCGSRITTSIISFRPTTFIIFMTYSLEGIRAKIHRADKNIQDLDREIAAFLRDNYRFATGFDIESRKYIYRAFGEPILPESFSVLVGEILYQFRSSLDHTITQLAKIGPGGGEAQKLEFPICTSPEAFKLACKRGKIEGVSTTARDTIESLQPYKTHTPVELSVLYWINELNRVDKHRLLLTVEACVQMATKFGIKTHIPDVEVIGMTPPVPQATRAAKDGAEVFHVQFGRVFDPNVEVEADFAFQVSFDYPGLLEHRPVIDVLVQMGQVTVLYIKEMCPDFAYP